jgi:tRNA threonylcarbamoyladenosine biosynthesis protein TsaE
MSISDRLRAGVATPTPEETRSIAAEWAATLPIDSTVALHGDLGAGKTTWVQGMAVGFGITEAVTSPTFTIFTLHQGAGRMLAHLDAYRIGSTEEVEALMLEEFLVSPWCLAIEWPDNLPGWISPDALHLDLDIRADGRHTIRLR